MASKATRARTVTLYSEPWLLPHLWQRDGPDPIYHIATEWDSNRMTPEDRESDDFVPAWLTSIPLSKVKHRHHLLQEAFLETLPHQESRLLSVPLGAHCAQCFSSGNTSSLRAELDSSWAPEPGTRWVLWGYLPTGGLISTYILKTLYTYCIQHLKQGI